MDKRKRERGSNFSENEVNLLMKCILEEIDIIENKKTDFLSNKDKTAAWDRVCVKFNSINEDITNREVASVKLKYDNIKRVLKKKISALKKSQNQTGGGPPILEDLKWYEEKLYPVLQLSIEGLPSEGDSDTYVLTLTEDGNVIEANAIDNVDTLEVINRSQLHTQENKENFEPIWNVPVRPSTSKETALQDTDVPVVIKTTSSSTNMEFKTPKSTSRKTCLRKSGVSVREKQNAIQSFQLLSQSKKDLADIQKECYTEELNFTRRKSEIKNEKWQLKKEILQEELKAKKLQTNKIKEEQDDAKILFNIKLEQEKIKLEIMKCQLNTALNQTLNK